MCRSLRLTRGDEGNQLKGIGGKARAPSGSGSAVARQWGWPPGAADAIRFMHQICQQLAHLL